jgi:hypothetical protein
MRLLACLIGAPQQGYDEPGIVSYAIRPFCPTSADGLQSGNIVFDPTITGTDTFDSGSNSLEMEAMKLTLIDSVIGGGSIFEARSTAAIIARESASTPLPAALPLFATGLGGLGLLGWRRKRKVRAIA